MDRIAQLAETAEEIALWFRSLVLDVWSIVEPFVDWIVIHGPAITALVFGALFIPVAAVFFTLATAGRLLTDAEDRTELGTWIGIFCAALGVIFSVLACVTFARWSDFNRDPGPEGLQTFFRLIGIVALIIALVASRKVTPVIVNRILHRKIERAADRSQWEQYPH